MSTYVGKMKNVLVAFNDAALGIRQKVQHANEQFKTDVAAEEVNKLRAQLAQAAEEVRDQISAILRQAVTAAKAWAAPDGTKIDAADLELLRGDFNLSAEDIHGLLVKHQGNGVQLHGLYLPGSSVRGIFQARVLE